MGVWRGAGDKFFGGMGNRYLLGWRPPFIWLRFTAKLVRGCSILFAQFLPAQNQANIAGEKFLLLVPTKREIRNRVRI